MVDLKHNYDDTTIEILPNQQQKQPPLRIVSLIPSATDICVHLGLGDNVVGITHCCDAIDLLPSVLVVTEDQINASSISQGDIHSKVVDNGKKALAAMEESENDTNAIDNGGSCPITTDEIPTLYPINKEILRKANPNLIITQDLCHVCAPSSLTVFRALREAGIDARVVLLTPMNLWDVITNLQQVADAAGISHKGKLLCDELRSNLQTLESVIQTNRKPVATPKTVLVMEWVDPPFCGGHWIPDMAELIGTELAISPTPEGRSRQITWEEIEHADPDIVIVACCGFDLDRNLKDAANSSHRFAQLRSHQSGTLYAANGDQYFARPSPKLLVGAVVMALCAYHDEPYLVEALLDLSFASAALNSFRAMRYS